MNGYREVKRLYPQYIGSIQQAANKGKYVLEVHGPFTCQEEEAIELLKEKESSHGARLQISWGDNNGE